MTSLFTTIFHTLDLKKKQKKIHLYNSFPAVLQSSVLYITSRYVERKERRKGGRDRRERENRNVEKEHAGNNRESTNRGEGVEQKWERTLSCNVRRR